ncbi:hypothetical protein TSOC_014968, partial [Tetrabaena socialis]
MNMRWLMLNNCTLNVTNTNNTNSTDANSPVLRNSLLAHSEANKLRKANGLIFEPVPGCPCAYRERCDYGTYINDVLEDSEVYTSNPKRFDEAMKFLTNYHCKRFPLLVTDRDLLSFANGVLELSSGIFTNYEGLAA